MQRSHSFILLQARIPIMLPPQEQCGGVNGSAPCQGFPLEVRAVKAEA